MGTTVLGLWAGLDSSVCSDGYCCLASLARRRLSRNEVPAHSIFRATRAQCVVELVVLPVAPRRPGVRRHSAALGADRRNVNRLLENQPVSRRIAPSISALGQFRFRTQLLGVAAQSTGPVMRQLLALIEWQAIFA